MTDILSRKFKPGYICSACAKNCGCKWPAGHCGTAHEGICDFCSQTANLCHTTDWNWPNTKMRPEEREF